MAPLNIHFTTRARREMREILGNLPCLELETTR